MAAHHFPANGVAYLSRRFRFAPGPQTTGDLFETGLGETRSGTEQNSFSSFFDREFRARSPRPGNTDALGQYDLTLGRKACGFHR
jgi:hypothetical protein